MKLLILSVGRRIQYIQYFKQELSGKGEVLAVDITPTAPALYYADSYYVLEKNFADPSGYMENVMALCKKEQVTHIMTLIDPELILLNEYRSELEEMGLTVLISRYEVVKNSSDKWLFYKEYGHILPIVTTYPDKKAMKKALDAGQAVYPLMAKRRMGSAGIGNTIINNDTELAAFTGEDYIFQQFIKGKEYGIDLYIDYNSGTLCSFFMKEKLGMRSGETDKSVALFDQSVLDVLSGIDKIKGLQGPLDLDIFITGDNKIHIIELNTRFGGGYPHAHYCGLNFVRCIVNNMEGKVNSSDNIGDYKTGSIMMKYNGLHFLD